MSRITATHLLVGFVCLMLALCVGTGLYIFIQNELHPAMTIDACPSKP